MRELTSCPVLLKENCCIHIAMAWKEHWPGKLLSRDSRTALLDRRSGYNQIAQKDANSLLDSSDLQQTPKPQLQEPDACPALRGRLMRLWQGRQRAQRAQRLGHRWSQSCIVGKSQRGKQICINVPECDMRQVRYGHIFCCPLTSSALDSCLHYLLGSNSPDKKCREKKGLEKKL